MKHPRAANRRARAGASEIVFLNLLALSTGDQPPDEFRIFGPGVNPTRKGPVVFDDLAARSVMAAYATHGTDIMVDLEHLSLDDTAPNYDPDARAWLALELRKGPELWATHVRWTPDGEARLVQKKQRYISPAMRVDSKSRRVLELVNIALCAMPATDRLTPLVAARARTATQGSTMKTNPKLLAALGLADDATDEEVAAAMADVMKDPAKFAAMMSAAFDADDQEDAETAKKDGDGGGEESEEDKRKRLSADPPKPAAPAPKPGAAAPPPKPGAAPAAKPDAAMKATQAALAAEVMALTLKVNAGAIKETILANRTKFTPALELWAIETFAADPAGLDAWLKAAPVLSTASAIEKQKAGGAASGGKADAIKLTREDVEMCRLTGTDPKLFLKHKRELRAGTDPDALTALIDEEV